MSGPKYLIDGEYAPPTKKKDTTSKLTDEDRLEAERMAEIKSQETSVRLATEDQLAKERLSEGKSQKSVSESLQIASEDTGLPVSLGGKPKKGSIGASLVGFDPIATIITEVADVGVSLRDAAAEAKLEGDNLKAGIGASAYMATQIGIGLIEGYTFFVRPHKWVETGQAIVKGVTDIVTSPDPLKVVATGAAAMGAVIATDPVAFVGRTTGSIMGGIAAGKTISRIRGPKTVPYEPPTDTDIQDFLVSEDIYPHQVVLSPDDMTLIPESTVIISDLGGDFLESHLVPRGKWSSKRITGYRQTGADLIQELVPEGVGEPTTLYHPMSVPYPIFEHTPGIDLSVGKIVLPRGLKMPIALGTITGIASIEQPTVDTPDLAIVQKTQELIDAALKQEVSISSVTKHKGIQTPKIEPQILPEYTIKPDTEDIVIPISFPPQYKTKPIQEPIIDISPISLTQTKIIQKPFLETKVERVQEVPITFSRYDYRPQVRHDPLFLRPLPRKRRGRTKPTSDVLGWEPRRYPVKSAEEMLFGSSQRKKKARPKKKTRRRKPRRREIRLV